MALAELVVFGHDARDAALQRRIAAFGLAGMSVFGFTMRRGAFFNAPWPNVDLGETFDANFRQRLAALWRARPIVAQHLEKLRRADLIYARNLDMLALAHWARHASGGRRAKLVYECLDIHRFLARDDMIGATVRGLERRLLADVDRVVVSSPAFTSEYFERRHPGRARTVLIENRLPPGFDYGPRPFPTAMSSGRVRLGWFGNLRCRRSLALLLDLAARFPDRIEIVLRGAPARTELIDFEQGIAGYANVSFGGRYAWPDDLAALYASVDLVWAGDFHDPGANSKWLLPNRLYEGGYYGAPAIAPAESETGRWLARHQLGFTLQEPLEQTLPDFIETLTIQQVEAARNTVLAAPDSLFVQPADEIKTLLESILAERRA